MKKIISVAVSMLVAFPAFAGTVSIGSLSVAGQLMSASGSATYEEGDTLTVSLKGIQDLINGGTQEFWDVSKTLLAGSYTLEARVGDSSVSQDFRIMGGQGMAPCQLDKTCPLYGQFAPQIPDQNVLGSAPTWHYVNPGQEGCMPFFTQPCLIKG